VIAVSRDLAETMREIGLHEGEIDVIPNGVDRERFHPRELSESRSGLGLSVVGRVLVCVGQLVPLRGHDLLLRALARDEAPADVDLHVLGDGPLRRPLEAQATALGLEGRVHFHGAVPHERIPFWFSASNASVQLNTSAGSPNAVLESIACGTPVLATDIPEMREVVRGPDEGELVPLEDRAVARGLARLLGRRAAPAGDAVPGWSEVAGRVLECFERALCRPGSSRS
jgi:glycosyltransferase involved in cell wall biosynthesis